MFQKDKKVQGKTHAAGDSDKKRTECTPRKWFRCGSVDNLIAKCTKPPKYNRKQKKKFVPVKGVTVHCKKNARMEIMILNKRYMHIWHECLVMTKVLVDISVTVCNWPIRF